MDNSLQVTNMQSAIMPNKKGCKAQSILEFTFTMIVASVLLGGMLKLFIWTATDMARRRQAHEKVLTAPLSSTGGGGPLEQIKPTFYGVSRMDAAVPSNLYDF